MNQIARTKRLTNYPRHKPYPQATWTFWDITNGNDPKPKLVVPKQDNDKLNYEYVPKPNLFKPKITILKPEHGYDKKKVYDKPKSTTTKSEIVKPHDGYA